jgi:MoaA/NifB/PqqE/SkfB family radical SAM enzyme
MEKILKNLFKNRYILLRLKIVLNLLYKKKISFKKVHNFFSNYFSYFFRNTIAGKSPIMINFELWNECNESCVFCRSNLGQIYDLNPLAKNNGGGGLEKGKLDIEIYKNIISELKDYLMLAIPYINGEPFMTKSLYEAVDFSSKNNVATLVASNGILINESNSQKILDCGLDVLKVHISGFTKQVHNIEHRKGDIELIKKNLEFISNLNYKNNYKTLIILDYIHYKHNEHELQLARDFAKKNNLIFNLRQGIKSGLENLEGTDNFFVPKNLHCPYLWSLLSIDWNNKIYPCCNYVLWSNQDPYEIFKKGTTSIIKLWNSSSVQKMRNIHLKQGREPIAICSNCPQSTSAFKF